ncbi:DUF4132 domain-containing protein [Yinghuangia seranimata]|uniref:DUF4132 domain-containing protein n=1 Tax=Yinghuangia seranimata TaxID=408067 RepID=UPI00248ACAB7|nr:DUF4132 domain-containing protein [Yinghuangia seranimata]MDI2129627.1 DUF4132 domain-containing protein [Yinghuangia seranimata]
MRTDEREHVVQQDTGRVERPDEDTFEMPDAWRKKAQPRRGGVVRKPAKPLKNAASLVDAKLFSGRERISQLLDHPRSHPDVVAAARAHLDGDANPLGAAAVAQMAPIQTHVHLPYVDVWVAERGLAFAACAVVELYDTHVGFESGTGRGDSISWLDRVEEPHHAVRMHSGVTRDDASRVRALLAAADQQTYDAVVGALAAHRGTRRRRVVASYLVPTERDWLEECLEAAVPDAGDARFRHMLLCSLSDPVQLSFADGDGRFGWNGAEPDVIGALADGVGPAFAGLFAHELTSRHLGSQARKQYTGILAELPTDEAFTLLLGQIEDRHGQAGLQTAARRSPVRALRLLAPAASGTGKPAAIARQMLTAHVAAYRALVEDVLPELDASVVAVVAPVLGATRRDPAAPADALPTVLVDPPWLRDRSRVDPKVVTGLVPPAVERVDWREGEQARWAEPVPWLDQIRAEPEWVDLLRDGTLPPDRAVALFMTGRPEDWLADVAAWKPAHQWGLRRAFKPFVARFGTAGIAPVLRLAAAHPSDFDHLIDPMLSLGAARLAATWQLRGQVLQRTSEAWLKRHGADAARLLVPDAVGRPGTPRRAAERALRLLAALHGEETVRSAAAEYGPEASEAIGDLFSSDPLVAALPDTVPALPDWADPAALPQIRLRDGSGMLPDEATAHVMTMLAISPPGMPYPCLYPVKEACTPDSLADFGWQLFEAWRLAGMPSKEAWPLPALGVLGDDETVRRLDPVVRAWPGEGGHARAVDGLGVLAAIGSDVALMHLHRIGQRVKFKALKESAQAMISEVARGLGLSDEQLADRLVPDFGLDASGGTVVDYGTRTFTVRFDEQLKPYVLDEDGKRRKDLPAPGARDDAELAPAERKRYAALKKDVRTAAADTLLRLEGAMVSQRAWSVREFETLLVQHPLVTHVAKRLVWIAETDDATVGFRVAEDNTYADHVDDPVELAEGATVRVAHPLHLGDQLGSWSELFADYDILQPFPQLGRPSYALAADEADGHELKRFAGFTVPTGKVMSLERRGWERGAPQDAGAQLWISRYLGAGRSITIALDPGISIGYVDGIPEQTLRHVSATTNPGDYRIRYRPTDTTTVALRDLDPVLLSEVLRDLEELTAGATR